jgi:hypothetical protein
MVTSEPAYSTSTGPDPLGATVVGLVVTALLVGGELDWLELLHAAAKIPTAQRMSRPLSLVMGVEPSW